MYIVVTEGDHPTPDNILHKKDLYLYKWHPFLKDAQSFVQPRNYFIYNILAKVWNIPGWYELGWKTYDPNSIPTLSHPEPRPTTPIVLVDISSYSYLK